MRPYTWQLYSKKLTSAIMHPLYMGSLSERMGMRLVVGEEGFDQKVKIYLLVDETDGVIADAKYQLFGTSALLAACEGACALALRKNYAQVQRFTADLIDKELGMPQEAFSHLNFVLSALDAAVTKCEGLPLPDEYVAPPMPTMDGEVSEYPGFTELSKARKIAVIEQVIDVEIRPYIELDAGGVRIIDLKDNELLIAYEGACTSCFSATGATLNAIAQIVRTKIHPDLEVKPDLSTLEF